MSGRGLGVSRLVSHVFVPENVIPRRRGMGVNGGADSFHYPFTVTVVILLPCFRTCPLSVFVPVLCAYR